MYARVFFLKKNKAMGFIISFFSHGNQPSMTISALNSIVNYDFVEVAQYMLEHGLEYTPANNVLY